MNCNRALLEQSARGFVDISGCSGMDHSHGTPITYETLLPSVRGQTIHVKRIQ